MRQSAVIQRNWQSLIKPEKLEVEPGADPAQRLPSAQTPARLTQLGETC